jgi:drug/metabolite transporter (DMT)-like permease
MTADFSVFAIGDDRVGASGTPRDNTVLLANIAAAVASLCAGGSIVATRIAVVQTNPLSLAFYRYIIGALCFAPFLPMLWPRERIPLVDWVKVAVLGSIFFGFFPWAFSAALQYTTAARGAIGIATIPVQTLIAAALFGRERLTRRAFCSVALAFAGIVIVFGPEAYGGTVNNHLTGDGLMLLGAFSAAVYWASSRPVFSAYGPMFVTGIGVIFGLLSLTPFAAAKGALGGWPQFNVEAWAAVVFLGTVGGAIQFSLLNWALRWLPPSRAVIYLTLNPISAMMLGNLMLGEQVTLLLILGLFFVVSGILVANVGRNNKATSA